MALLIPTVALLMLYAPPLQDMTVRWATTWGTQHTGTRIEVQSIRLRFPLHIEIRGVRVGEFVEIGDISTDIRLRPLIRGSIEANHVSAQDITVCTNTPTPSSISAQRFRADNLSYDWRSRHMHLHHILLADAHATLHERTTPPTRRTAKRLPLSLTISNIKLLRIGASYNTTKAQLQGTTEAIMLHEVMADTSMNFEVKSVAIEEGELIVQSPQFTTSCSHLNVQSDSLHYTPRCFEGRLTQLTFTESHGINLQEGTAAIKWEDGAFSLPHIRLRTTHSSFDGRLSTLTYNTANMTIDANADIRIGYPDALRLAQWIKAIPSDVMRLYPTETIHASIAVGGSAKQLTLTRCHISLPNAFDIGISGTLQNITTPKLCEAQCHVKATTHNLNFLTPLIDNTALRIPANMMCRGDVSYAPDTLHALCTLSIDRGTATVVAGYRPTNRTYDLQMQTDSLDIHQVMPNGKLGITTLQAHLTGSAPDYRDDDTTLRGELQVDHLQWGDDTSSTTFTNALAQITKEGSKWYAHAESADSLMQWSLTATMKHTPDTIRARFHAQIDDLNLRALQIADTDIHPALQCHATLSIDSGIRYSLRSRFSDIALHTATQSIYPQPLNLQATLTADTAQLAIRSGDLTLTASAHTEGFPWQWQRLADTPQPLTFHPSPLTHIQAALKAGNDNPVSNYLALIGIKVRAIQGTIAEHKGIISTRLTAQGIATKSFETDSIALAATYTQATLHAHLQSSTATWHTTQMQLQGRANATFAWSAAFTPDSLSGTIYLSSIQYSLPTYSLHLHTTDTLCIPLERGGLTFTSIPLYATGKQPLILDGKVMLMGHTPTAQLRLTARDTNLLQASPTRGALLYGRALVSGNIVLDGPFNALSIAGDLQLRPSSSIHYIYKDAILTASNQLDNVVEFTSFTTSAATPPKRRTTSNLSMNINIAIDPTAQLEVSLGANKQNNTTIQGGGMLTLQYIPATGLRLAGRYTIEQGELNMNVPLLHVSHMAMRTGSTITWEGNPLNPLLNISAEERIRASVTLDGSPQSVLFVAGVSLSDTMEKLSVQFTLAAPENAAMQNTLAALSPEERGKLSVALLTTGLYLGEGGTGNLMNTALMGILQAQIDNISRDAFRTVDVSVGIESLPDGVSGVSTRTDYSFSVAKRLWNNRIRIIIGGSVTTSNERIEDDAVIDNISIEWRISPVGNQYLRFFYDKNFESILEGEIRETGVGYAYRRRF